MLANTYDVHASVYSQYGLVIGYWETLTKIISTGKIKNSYIGIPLMYIIHIHT